MARVDIPQTHLQVLGPIRPEVRIIQGHLQILKPTVPASLIIQAHAQVLKANTTPTHIHITVPSEDIRWVSQPQTAKIVTLVIPPIGELQLGSDEQTVTLITPTATTYVIPDSGELQLGSDPMRPKAKIPVIVPEVYSKGKSTVDNASCKDEGKVRIPWVDCLTGLEIKMAIDELGRFFVQGANWSGSSGWPDDDTYPDYDLLVAAYGNGNFNPWLTTLRMTMPPGLPQGNWKSMDTCEYQNMVLSHSGEAWATGWNEREAWGKTEQECIDHGDGPDDYEPWGFEPFMPGYRFKLLRSTMYGWLGITLEDELLAWGWSWGGEIGLGYDPVTGGYLNTHIPTTPPGFEGVKVKFVGGDWENSIVVTMDDRVFSAGWEVNADKLTTYDPAWWDSLSDEEELHYTGTFTEVRFYEPLPPGATIIDADAYLYGGAVVDSEGNLYFFSNWDDEVIGFGDAFEDVTFKRYYLNKVVSFGYKKWNESGGYYDDVVIPKEENPKFVKIRCCDWSCTWGIDREGYAWATGYTEGILGLPTNKYSGYEDPVWSDELDAQVMTYAGSREYKGAKWIQYSWQAYYAGGSAIDLRGVYYVWGSNWTYRLGLGYPGNYGDYWVQTPTIAPESVNESIPWPWPITEDMYEGNNYFPEYFSKYLSPPVQGPEHDPCGHWHLRNQEDETPSNCWIPAIDVQDAVVFVVARGRWNPFEFMFWEYDINANTWTKTYDETIPLYSSGHIGEAKWVGDVQAFYNAVFDFDPFWISPSVYNGRMGLWVRNAGATVYYDLPEFDYMDGKGKMAITPTGAILICGKVGSNIEWRMSRNYGVTWTTVLTVPVGSVADYGVYTSLNYINCIYMEPTNGKLWNLYSYNTDGVTWSGPIYTYLAGSLSPHPTRFNVGINKKANYWVITAINVNGDTQSWYGSTQYIGYSASQFNIFGLTDSSNLIVQGSTIIIQLKGGDKATVGSGNSTPTEYQMPFPTGSGNLEDFAADEDAVSVWSAWGFYIQEKEGQKFAIMLSEDGGQHWVVRTLPLNFNLEEGAKLHEIMFYAPALPHWKEVEKYKPWGYKMPPEKKGSNNISCDHED